MIQGGSAKPLSARIKGVNRDVSDGKADTSNRTVCFLPTRVNKKERTGNIPGAFFRGEQAFGRVDTDRIDSLY